MPDLYKFMDYRLYLKAVYQEKKSENFGFSYQVMTQKMGFKAKDFIYRVIKGQKNLSIAGIAAVSRSLGHDNYQSRYFSAMVCFNQAKSATEKEFYYDQLILKTGGAGINTRLKRLNQGQLELFSEWHHLPIRALIDMCAFTDDYSWLAKQLYPAISKKQARQSIQHLENLGLIQKDINGIYRVSEKGLITDSEVESLSLVKFYNSCARLSTDALNNLPKHLRNVSGVTLGISRDSYLKIVGKITQFRREISELAREDGLADQVYQLQISLFPFTRTDLVENQP